MFHFLMRLLIIEFQQFEANSQILKFIIQELALIIIIVNLFALIFKENGSHFIRGVLLRLKLLGFLVRTAFRMLRHEFAAISSSSIAIRQTCMNLILLLLLLLGCLRL